MLIMALAFRTLLALPWLAVTAFVCFGILQRLNWVRYLFAVWTVCYVYLAGVLGIRVAIAIGGLRLSAVFAWFLEQGAPMFLYVVAVAILFSRTANAWFRGQREPAAD